MSHYIMRRLLALIPTLVFASVIVFATVRMIPGSIIDLMLSQNDVGADKMGREQLVAALGLDRSMPEQYLRWVGALAQGDLGNSLWHSTPVLHEILQRLPVTFELGALALVVGLVLALPIGVYSAMRQDTATDLVKIRCKTSSR
jgi:peptide/nickel transport system permease protein